MNLDGDKKLERVVAWDHVSFDHSSHRGEIVAIDRCRAQDVRHELAPPGRYLPVWSVQGARELGRRGVLLTMHYNDGKVIARVARLRAETPGLCPAPVLLFDYSTESPPEPPPPDHVVRDIRLDVGDYARRHPGRELMLAEHYAESTTAPVRAIRRTYLRFRTRSERYVAYRTVVRPA